MGLRCVLCALWIAAVCAGLMCEVDCDLASTAPAAGEHHHHPAPAPAPEHSRQPDRQMQACSHEYVVAQAPVSAKPLVLFPEIVSISVPQQMPSGPAVRPAELWYPPGVLAVSLLAVQPLVLRV